MRRARPLPTVVAKQRGLVTRAQLRAAGWSRDNIDHAVRQWPTVVPEVYLATGDVVDVEIRAAAALLRWPDALLSHTTAAAELGWPVLDRMPSWPRWLHSSDWPDLNDVHLSSERRRRVPAGFVSHRTSPGPAVYVREVRVTEHVRTLLDVARTAPLPIALPIIDAATHVSPWLLGELANEANRRGGHRNIARAQRAIALASPEAESILESLLRLLILLSGLPPPELQIPVHMRNGKTYYADMGYSDKRLLIEADGRDHHSKWRQVADDMMRHNSLVGQGWRVLRFTWAQVLYQPDLVIAAIREALCFADRDQ